MTIIVLYANIEQKNVSGQFGESKH